MGIEERGVRKNVTEEGQVKLDHEVWIGLERKLGDKGEMSLGPLQTERPALDGLQTQYCQSQGRVEKASAHGPSGPLGKLHIHPHQ